MANQDTKKPRIIWVDDEIQMLEAHIAFLTERGFEVTPCSSGDDAIEVIAQHDFELVLLDEMMPGKDGLATLVEIKEMKPHLPVVMVTKSEEETLMDDAIGQKIDDYLTKPVNPSQVLMVVKKLVQSKKIVSGKLPQRYISDMNRINRTLMDGASWTDWVDAYRLSCEWNLEMDQYGDEGLKSTHSGSYREWNSQFTRFYEKNYEKWVASKDRPPLSVDVIDRFVTPHLKGGGKVIFVVIDCMRLDLWLRIAPILADYFNITTDYYYSIIPSATPFARNSIFAGKFPSDLARVYPDDWKAGQDDETSRNKREDEMLERQMAEKGIKIEDGVKYIKVLRAQESNDLKKQVENYQSSQLIGLVINFVDALTHGRSNNILLREMVKDEAAFRSLMQTWFEHSTLFAALRMLSRKDVTVVITSDHGSTLCSRGTVAHGKKDTSTNLRYKYGDNINCNPKEALLIKNPDAYKLPCFSVATTYIIAREDFYFVYPNRYNEFQRQFQNSFQHGGISMDEIILPVATLKPRG